MGEVNNLSEETGRSTIDFLRGIRDSILRKNSEGNWESLLYTRNLRLSKTESCNSKGKGWKVEEAVGGVHSVCLAASQSGGLKSYWTVDQAGSISKGGGSFSPAPILSGTAGRPSRGGV